MNKRVEKSLTVRSHDHAIDARMMADAMEALSEFRRSGLSPAPFRLAMPFAERLRRISLDEILSKRRLEREARRAAAGLR